MTAPLTDYQRILHTLAKKTQTVRMLEAEIAALEELLGTLARTEEMRVRRDAKQRNGEVRG